MIKDMTTQGIRTELRHETDGPITAFVLISRATELVRYGCNPERTANALFEELASFDYLTEEAEEGR